MSKRRHFMISWLMPLAGTVVVAGLFLYWQWPSLTRQIGPDEPVIEDSLSGADIADLYSQQGTLAESDATDNPAGATKRISSADFVAVHATVDGSNVQIDLDIKPHWHINANPASLDFLIPTEIEISADGAPVPVRLNYPSGHAIEVGLGQPIAVYSGRALLSAEMPEPSKSQPLTVNARVQACNDAGRCLAPSTLSTVVPGSKHPAMP